MPDVFPILFSPFRLARYAACPWADFDRKYVIRPPVDSAIAYSTALADPRWPTTW